MIVRSVLEQKRQIFDSLKSAKELQIDLGGVIKTAENRCRFSGT